MKKCNVCGNIMPDDAAFCTACGADISSVQSEGVNNVKPNAENGNVIQPSDTSGSDDMLFEQPQQFSQQNNNFEQKTNDFSQPGQYSSNSFNQPVNNRFAQNNNVYNPQQNNYSQPNQPIGNTANNRGFQAAPPYAKQENQSFNYANQNFQSQNLVPVPKKNMIEAYKAFFKNYVNFKGRARRSDYWLVSLMNLIIGLVCGIIVTVVSLAANVSMEEMQYWDFSNPALYILALVYFLLGLYFLATFIPGISLTVRRIHDIGKSGWVLLLGLIPFGGIILLVYECTDSQMGPNKYGPNPKYASPSNNNFSN